MKRGLAAALAMALAALVLRAYASPGMQLALASLGAFCGGP